MTNQKLSGFFPHPQEKNLLWKYLQRLDSETAKRMSQPSPEAAQIIEVNILQMLGGLPLEDFEVTITTSKENLATLLASAMLSGYCLHNAEQRLALEKNLVATNNFDNY
jgi:hypothetical protein